MTPSFASYLGGSLSLVVIASALGFGAHHVRRWIVPEFSGALARLAELVFGISMLVLTLQLVGTLGLLRAGWIPAACAVVGIAAGLLGRARAPADAARRPVSAPRTARFGLVIAIAVASLVVVDWSFPTQFALDRGINGGDST